MTAFEDGLWTRLVQEHDADRVALGSAPKQRSRRPLLVGASGVVAVTVAGVLAAVLSLAGGASNAFAGWTPQPSAPTAAQLAAAKAFCARNVPTPGLPLKLTDTRGPFTFLVYSDGASNDFCTLGPSFRNASGWSTSPPVAVPAGRLYLWAEQTTTDAGKPYGFVIARAGDGVSAATLTLENGTEVTATVQNGWAVAWWPGTHQLTSARAGHSFGHTDAEIPAQPVRAPAA